jgi:CRP-like cAMP-binding protein
MDWAILNVLSDDERRAVLAVARRRKFDRNEVIFHEGDPGDTLHLVSQGHVALRVTTPLGDTATVRIVKAGEFFGELAVVSPGPRNATAVALEGAETRSLHRTDFEGVIATHPTVERVLVDALVSEVRRLATQLLDALYVPVEKRVWRRLVDLVELFGDGTGDTVIPLTQEDIAQVVGTTRPTVNRLLREGEEAGVLRIARGRIEVVDAGALQRRAR